MARKTKGSLCQIRTGGQKRLPFQWLFPESSLVPGGNPPVAVVAERLALGYLSFDLFNGCSLGNQLTDWLVLAVKVATFLILGSL